MSDTPLAVLLLGVPADLIAAFKGEHDLALEVRVASSIEDALAAILASPADLVIVGTDISMEPLGLAHRLRAAARGQQWAMIRVQTPGEEPVLPSVMIANGFDGILRWPASRADIAYELHRVWRLRDIGTLARDRLAEIAILRQSLGKEQTEVLSLLAQLIDESLPGAADRRSRIEELCSRLAGRFEIPREFLRDLELAARFQEIGRLTLDAAPGEREPSSDRGVRRYTSCSRSLLEKISDLRVAASLVGALDENWDGSGFPGHLRQGQIPLRSRLVRVALDFSDLLEAGRTSAQAIEELRSHAGTLYDPLVVAHLDALTMNQPSAESRDRWIRLPLPQLRVGMVLAEDLYTNAGIKLLARETVISASVLDTILRRNRFEPIVSGVTVHSEP
ncbi:MAG: HD domain-containing phosphohydrolase [Gemmatimonadota bacterium]